MREPEPGPGGLYGLLAEFPDPDTLKAAVASSRKAGLLQLDTFSPFPIEGMAEALGFHDRRVPLLVLAGGLGGAALGYGMQVYTNLDYPLNVGGRGLLPAPAFMLITFELFMLGAVACGILGMLVLNRLPRLHHPLFDVEAFRSATLDKFFLLVFAADERFDPDRTRALLDGMHPLRVDEVRLPEEVE